MKKLICALAVISVTSVALTANAEELDYNWIGSESELVGSFNSDDNSVNDLLDDLFESVSDVDLDFSVDSDDDQDFFNDEELEEELDYEDIYDPEEWDNIQDYLSDPPEEMDSEIDLYSDYNSYYGGISSTYLEFMRGYLPKLKFKEHYVCARVSQYDYLFAYGEQLDFNGSFFTGRDVKVVKYNTYNSGSFSFSIESAFNLYPGSTLTYSDLSEQYPSLADTSAVTLRQILILFIIFCLCLTIDHMYQVRKYRKIGVH